MIAIVDYGLGNLFNVQKAFDSIGAEAEVTEDPSKIENARGVVIPGVGAFGDGMEGLRKRDLVLPIRDFAATGRPVIGICLGMQLLMTESEEFGVHKGLDLIKGRVVSLQGQSGFDAKVPHVGWSGLSPAKPWDRTVFNGLSTGDEVYFVHSFAVVEEAKDARLAETSYGGVKVCAAVQSANVSGCQFHPEKSRGVGLSILKNFAASVA